jgi:hypothetical protein
MVLRGVQAASADDVSPNRSLIQMRQASDDVSNREDPIAALDADPLCGSQNFFVNWHALEC